MRRVSTVLTVLLVAAACGIGAEGGESTTSAATPVSISTSSTAEPTITTTTAPTTTTSEVLDCPRELGIRTDADGAPTRLVAGECYSQSHFEAAMFQFEFENEGWSLVVSGTKIISMADAIAFERVRAVSIASTAPAETSTIG